MKTYTKKSNYNYKYSKRGNSTGIKNLSFFTKFSLFFSGFNFMFGSIFFVIGMVFLIVFSSFIDFNDLKFSDKDPITGGRVTAINPTSSSVNDIPVFNYEYTYTVDGKKYKGESYRPGYYELTIIKVQYLPKNPAISRIEGMNSGSFEPWVLLFLLIFPVIGILFLISGIRKNLRHIRIITIGKVAFGKFIEMKATGASVNNNQVYKMYFEFTADDNQVYRAMGETYKTYELQDEELEPLVYNPANPNEAIMLDALPKIVRNNLSEEIEKAKII